MNNAFSTRFLESIKDHQLTIIENSEHAKIFRFARPDTVALSCTIAYVADTCLITGDMGHYLLGRLLNPYAFFLRNQSVFSFDYIKEKVLARDTSGRIDVYDGDIAEQKIRQIITNHLDGCDDEDELEAWNGLTRSFGFIDFDDESEVKEWLDDARSSFNSAFDEINASNFTTLSDNFVWCVQAVVYATRLFEQEIENGKAK